MPVPDTLVDDLVARTRDGAIDLPRRNRLRPGDPLRVVTGPFRDQIAELVSLRPHQRVEVLLQILGAQQRVELPRAAVEAIRSD
jgi:transcriptional antiterminator RfaH